MQLNSVWYEHFQLGPAILIYVCVKLESRKKKKNADEKI